MRVAYPRDEKVPRALTTDGEGVLHRIPDGGQRLKWRAFRFSLLNPAFPNFDCPANTAAWVRVASFRDRVAADGGTYFDLTEPIL